MSYRVALRDWWPLLGGVGVGMLGLAVVVGFGILLSWLIDRPDGKARAVCDQMVERLFNSNDSTEVMRAGLIIERLNCSVRWRL